MEFDLIEEKYNVVLKVSHIRKNDSCEVAHLISDR